MIFQKQIQADDGSIAIHLKSAVVSLHEGPQNNDYWPAGPSDADHSARLVWRAEDSRRQGMDQVQTQNLSCRSTWIMAA